jgi:hypothetical protein
LGTALGTALGTKRAVQKRKGLSRNARRRRRMESN